MTLKHQTLCDWSKKDIEQHADLLYELVTPAVYYCRKCARTAAVKNILCKPKSWNRQKAEK